MGSSFSLGALAGPTLLIVGLSMFLQSEVWVDRAKAIMKRDEERVMFALIELVAGLAIVNAHNLWEISPWVIITIVGWMMVIEGAFHLLVPGKKAIQLLKGFIQPRIIWTAGLVIGILGLWLSYLVYLD